MKGIFSKLVRKIGASSIIKAENNKNGYVVRMKVDVTGRKIMRIREAIGKQRRKLNKQIQEADTRKGKTSEEMTDGISDD